MKAIILFLFLISTHASAINCDLANPISIRYLGVGALDIHYQGQRVLTDPFYSPQSILDIISFTPYQSDKLAIEKALGKANQDVNTILVGHGHYDHAADIPALTDYLAHDVAIISSPSTQYLLKPKFEQEKLIGLTEKQFNQWIIINKGWIRIKGIASEHAPQALGINLFPEIHKHPLEHSPKYIWQWTQGTNINWLVDFLATPYSNNVIRRIFIQTSASEFPIGAPRMNDGILIDTMFLAAASFDNVENYPAGLINQYKPKKVVLIHWENFFKPWIENTKALSLIDFEKLMSNKNLAGRKNTVEIGQPRNCY